MQSIRLGVITETNDRVFGAAALSVMATHALRLHNMNPVTAAEALANDLLAEEPLSAQLLGETAIRSATLALMRRICRDLAGEETDGAAHISDAAWGSQATAGSAPSTESERAQSACGGDARLSAGDAPNPNVGGAHAPSGCDAALSSHGPADVPTVHVREHMRRPPGSPGPAPSRVGGDAYGAHGEARGSAAPNPSGRTLASLRATTATAAAGLSFRMLDGRAIGDVPWHELPTIAAASERQARIVRRLLDWAAMAPSGALVKDVVNDRTLTNIIQEVDGDPR